MGEAEIVRVDLRGPSPEADCLDCLVALPSAIERMRQTANEEELPARIIRATRLAFEALDATGKGTLMVASSSQDLLYRDVMGLTTMDRYTRSYFGRAVCDFFLQLSKRHVRTFYILDNALRDDRYEAVLALFDIAGILTVSPRRDGKEWPASAARIRECLGIGGHVAYIEPDAEVNHIDAAKRLAAGLGCVATFRNLAPEDAQFDVLGVPHAPVMTAAEIQTGRLVRRLPPGPLDIVGDIHGGREALETLIDKLGYDLDGRHPAGRRLVFVGDLCDRGPDSPGVVRRVQSWVEAGRALAIAGNHELNLLRREKKHGNHWFYGTSFDPEFGRCAAISEREQEPILDFFRSLPVALEREDLRIAHAAWVHSSVESCRAVDMPVDAAYRYYRPRGTLSRRRNGGYVTARNAWTPPARDGPPWTSRASLRSPS